MTHKHPIDRASDVLGGAAKLAALLGVSAQAISNWKERGVPIERCLAIELATNGEVTRRDLRDDWLTIWPELDRRDDQRDTDPAPKVSPDTNGKGAHAKAAKHTPREKRDDRRDTRMGDHRSGDKPSNRKGR